MSIQSNKVSIAGVIQLTVALAAAIPAAAVNIGLNDDFSTPGLNGWANQDPAGTLGNPVTGGVDGVDDGYLEINDFFGRLGSFNSDDRYTGNWTAAGIQAIQVHLNDTGPDDDIEIHLLISDNTSGATATTWSYNTGFIPPNNSWAAFTADLTDESLWTRIRGSESFADVLADVKRFHLRHDLAPFISTPNFIDADFGVDNISLLVPEPTALTLIAVAGLTLLTRPRKNP